MEILGLAGIVAFAGTSLIVGLRLVWLWRSTRQFPELAIGASFLLSGFVGLALSLTSTHATGLAPGLRMGLRLASVFLSNCGYALMAAFVWRVFRQDSAVGRLGFGLALLGLAGGFALQLVQAQPGGPSALRPGFWLNLAVTSLLYAWVACESLAYWWRLRKRVRIGLASALVANRFLLWGIATGAVFFLWIHMAVSLASSETMSLSGGQYLVIALLGFVCAGACWTAFLPPGFYRRRFATPEASG